jgi:hypothetical protein
MRYESAKIDVQRTWSENMSGRDSLEDLSIDGMKILKRIFNEKL